MNKGNKPGMRWISLLAYLGTVSLLLACMGIAAGSSETQTGKLQLDNGIVQVQDPDGGWVSVAGDSTFELVGNLENTDPWIVAGRTLETNDSTQTGDGLQVGDLVRVRGAALEGDNWLAYSIQPAQEQMDPIVILIGTVTSVDPWVVNGITLHRSEDTIVKGEIRPGTLVRVEILLLEDGTWEVNSIAPLGDPEEPSGCAAVVATIQSVDADQIQFLGWPEPVTFEDNNDNEENDDLNVREGQKVLVIVCVSEDGQLVVRQVVALNDEEAGDDPSDGVEKVLICHKPSKNAHTLSVASSAVPAHMAHGDTMGACP